MVFRGICMKLITKYMAAVTSLAIFAKSITRTKIQARVRIAIKSPPKFNYFLLKCILAFVSYYHINCHQTSNVNNHDNDV